MQLAVFITAALAIASFAAPATAAGTVDLSTGILNFVQSPVPGSPDGFLVVAQNDGTDTATNVVIDVTVPAGATVVDTSDNCTTGAGTVSCTIASLAPGQGDGGRVYLRFAATGSYQLTSSARADQPDANGDSTFHLGVDVVNENADLAGSADSARVVLGTQSTYRVFQHFTNLGPTAASAGSVSGTVTGGATIVPGSFSFVVSYFNDPTDLAGNCTIAATTFTCPSVFDGSVFYDITLPATPSTIVASATITGHADPNHANDTSTTTIALDAPAAEIYTQLVAVDTAIPSGLPFRVQGPVQNPGELDAQSLVAVLTAPTGWAIAVPPDPLPAGVSCQIISSPDAMRCTRTTLAAGDSWEVDALVTPPAGTGTGTVTLSVSTVTPETGTFPNDATVDIRYAPVVGRQLHIEPDTDLVDGQQVVLSGVGFVANAAIFYCEGRIVSGTPSAANCGGPLRTTAADSSGAFSVDVTVTRFLVVNNVGVIDCAQPQVSCGLGAGDLFAPGGQSVVAPMTFTPQPPVADPFNARIQGTVTDGSGHPVAGASVWAYVSTDTWVGSLQASTDASGHYVLEDAEPGIAYRIRFGAPTGSGLVTEWYGGPSSGGSPSRASAVDVRLTAEQPVVIADAQLAAGTSLTGTVLGPNGQPAGNVLVWAYRNADTWVGTYVATTAADGTYRIEGVEPATPLKILFAPAAGSGLAYEWFDNVHTRSAATPIVIAINTIGHANAQLASLP
jgi:hypothetical protein